MIRLPKGIGGRNPHPLPGPVTAYPPPRAPAPRPGPPSAEAPGDPPSAQKSPPPARALRPCGSRALHPFASGSSNDTFWAIVIGNRCV